MWRVDLFVVLAFALSANAASLFAQSPSKPEDQNAAPPSPSLASKAAVLKNVLETSPASVEIVKSEIGEKHPLLDLKDFTVFSDDLEAGLHEDPSGTKMPYRCFIPKNLPPGTKVPLVLFLHGSGQAGTDNNHLRLSPSALIFVQPQVQAKYPCVFVAPQCPKEHAWVCGDVYEPANELRMAVEIVDKLTRKYPFVDPERLYVTGLSAGGAGTWDAIAKFPQKFAAAAPIAAGWWDRRTIKEKRCIAVWAFYGEMESELTRRSCDVLLGKVVDRGGIALKTVYARTGHDSWTAAYAEPGLIPWLFRQRRNRER